MQFSKSSKGPHHGEPNGGLFLLPTAHAFWFCGPL